MKKEEIEQLKKCLEDKDRRLKKLERIIIIRNNILKSIGVTLLCFSWVIILLIGFYYNPTFVNSETMLRLFAFIGGCFSAGVTCLGWLFILIEKVWK